jgi:hypothetical protein
MQIVTHQTHRYVFSTARRNDDAMLSQLWHTVHLANQNIEGRVAVKPLGYCLERRLECAAMDAPCITQTRRNALLVRGVREASLHPQKFPQVTVARPAMCNSANECGIHTRRVEVDQDILVPVKRAPDARHIQLDRAVVGLKW